ncbi:MAG: hypothetical protein LC725_07650 [Lentisphaerae bacterium]|nr:hypothetical protein [Lentisphaerota bacterium]
MKVEHSEKTMTRQEPFPQGRMKRLSKAWYCGHAFVHWNMTIVDRRTGWLTPEFHVAFREMQFHALARHGIMCLVYCLMPDHLHLLWAGLEQGSDQDLAARFFRRFVNRALPEGVELQRQPWDVVLREADRERGALTKTAFYIAENPVRKNLVADARDWVYRGAQAAGYPALDVCDADYGEKIWKIYDREVNRRRANARPESEGIAAVERNS